MYGLRDVGDIDYITNTEKNFPAEVGDNHNSYLHFHETSADDLILNPQNYLWFEGMKVVSLEQVTHMKKMRRVGDIGKDIMDKLLAEKISSKRLETLLGAVMEFISYCHSAKNFNLDQLYEHLEPVFSQEGWRTKNFLREEEKILVICNYVIDDIVGVNNFLKNIREQKPTAKITFLTDFRSQKLIQNLKYADKIISLDTTFSQDIMWQICKFIELCRDSLWSEYFSTCYLPNLENNFALNTLFGYLSGACSRIGIFGNAEKVPADIQSHMKFFAQLLMMKM